MRLWLARLCPFLIPMACVGAVADEPLQNWFNDPFFQITSAIRNCPLPAGPFTSMADRRAQAHRRAEKGTTCWLAGECDRPKAYLYDADIATALRSTAQERKLFAGSSLWVTVQGRVVYVEGCAARSSDVARIDAFVRSVPYVQQSSVNVRTRPSARPPYRLMPAQ